MGEDDIIAAGRSITKRRIGYGRRRLVVVECDEALEGTGSYPRGVVGTRPVLQVLSLQNLAHGLRLQGTDRGLPLLTAQGFPTFFGVTKLVKK